MKLFKQIKEYARIWLNNIPSQSAYSNYRSLAVFNQSSAWDASPGEHCG